MSWLLWNSLTAAVLALLVALACRTFRPRPALAHLLWLAVLVKLVCPSVLSIELPAEPTAPRVVDLAAPLRPAPAPETPATSWTGLFVWLWLAGSAGMLGLYGLSALRMRRLVRDSDAPSEEVRNELARVAATYGVAVPRTVVSARCASPFLWTLGRLHLVLPKDLGQQRGRTALLAHELAHVRRGDPWVARLEAAIAVVLWWHPLFWVVRAEMREQAELACDAWALWAAPEARLQYADALIASLERESTDPALSVLAARPSARAAFERRLKMILNETVPYRLTGRTLAPLCALTLGLLAVPTLAQGQKKPAPTEIRVNGKPVSELSAKERAALLEALQRRDTTEEVRESRPELVRGRPLVVRSEPAVIEGHPLVVGRRLEPGEKLDALDSTIGSLLSGVGELAISEIRKDPDLKQLGITKDLELVIRGALGNEDVSRGLQSLVSKAMKHALVEVREELRSDPDLKELGIETDVEHLVEGFLAPGSGSSFHKAIGGIVQKALGSALRSEDADTTPRPMVKGKRLKLQPVEVEGEPLERIEVRGEPLEIEVKVKEVEGEPLPPKTKAKAKRRVEIR